MLSRKPIFCVASHCRGQDVHTEGQLQNLLARGHLIKGNTAAAPFPSSSCSA